MLLMADFPMLTAFAESTFSKCQHVLASFRISDLSSHDAPVAEDQSQQTHNL